MQHQYFVQNEQTSRTMLYTPYALKYIGIGSHPPPPPPKARQLIILISGNNSRGEVIPEQLAVSEPPRHNKLYIVKKIIYFCFL